MYPIGTPDRRAAAGWVVFPGSGLRAGFFGGVSGPGWAQIYLWAKVGDDAGQDAEGNTGQARLQAGLPGLHSRWYRRGAAIGRH